MLRVASEKAFLKPQKPSLLQQFLKVSVHIVSSCQNKKIHHSRQFSDIVEPFPNPFVSHTWGNPKPLVTKKMHQFAILSEPNPLNCLVHRYSCCVTSHNYPHVLVNNQYLTIKYPSKRGSMVVGIPVTLVDNCILQCVITTTSVGGSLKYYNGFVQKWHISGKPLVNHHMSRWIDTFGVYTLFSDIPKICHCFPIQQITNKQQLSAWLYRVTYWWQKYATENWWHMSIEYLESSKPAIWWCDVFSNETR